MATAAVVPVRLKLTASLAVERIKSVEKVSAMTLNVATVFVKLAKNATMGTMTTVTTAQMTVVRLCAETVMFEWMESKPATMGTTTAMIAPMRVERIVRCPGVAMKSSTMARIATMATSSPMTAVAESVDSKVLPSATCFVTEYSAVAEAATAATAQAVAC